MSINLPQLTQQVVDLSIQVGDFIRQEQQHFNYNDVEIKGLNDLVSYVDKTSEQKLVEKLEKIFPEAGFIVEENTKNEIKAYNWIIDPLDGTTNFVHGIPSYAISIALECQGEILLGVVYEISQNQCFYANKNGGAFLMVKKLQFLNVNPCLKVLLLLAFQFIIFLVSNHLLKRLRIL